MVENKPTASSDFHTVLLGDIGGTNIRLTLRRLNMAERTSTIVKDLTKFNSQQTKSVDEAILQFLDEFKDDKENWPKVGVIGIAGAVQNNCVKVTNVPHWPMCDGESVQQICKIDKFLFINDFAAAAYGVCNMEPRDYFRLCDQKATLDGPKIVMGPGTGLGEAFLTKSRFAPCYEVFPCEGGHVDFSPKDQIEYDLQDFAIDFIENSENIENQRGRGKITRVSLERLCAGPAVPLIYEFYKKRNPDMKRVLEIGDKAIKPDDILSHHVINAGIKDKDPLCKLVVKKFTEIFGREAGNFALKTLPSGGVYLLGGVTNGLLDYILTTDTFKREFYSKGRLEDQVRQVPLFVIKPETELGILGAEECAYRELGSFSKPESNQFKK